jgi:hypothetical protein
MAIYYIRLLFVSAPLSILSSNEEIRDWVRRGHRPRGIGLYLRSIICLYTYCMICLFTHGIISL